MTTSPAVQAGIMKLALADIDQAILRLRVVQRDMGTNVQLDTSMDKLVAASNELDRFADRLRG